MLSSNDPQRKEINLPRVYMTSIESFLKTLKVFKEAEQLKTFKISLGINLTLHDLLEITQNLDCSILPANTVSMFLDIYIYVKDLKLPDERAVALQKIFGKVRFNISLLLNSGCKGSLSEFKKCVPVMKNNFKCEDLNKDDSEYVSQIEEDELDYINDLDNLADLDQ